MNKPPQYPSSTRGLAVGIVLTAIACVAWSLIAAVLR